MNAAALTLVGWLAAPADDTARGGASLVLADWFRGEAAGRERLLTKVLDTDDRREVATVAF